MTVIITLKSFWNKYASLIVLMLLLGIYLAASSFIALNLKPGIIPDEPAHFTFSKHFASTIGIPPDTVETYSWGWYIKQNPFLYYWINGRIINITQLIFPQISDASLLVVLRFVNVFYSLGTIIFCFLLSKQVIEGRWWQLLPVFLLTHTLMFVFLAGGINYDNLANLLSIAGLYFLIRTFQEPNFTRNSLLWIIMIALGTLVKFTILPLALAMAVVWIAFIIKKHKEIDLLPHKPAVNLMLSAITLLLFFGNFAIYGVNLIRYQALRPPCREILLESQCELSPYARRASEIALDQKLSIRESINQGYPSPTRYVLIDWVWHMLNRSFGMIGHQSYFPLHLMPFYQIFFYLILFFGVFDLFYYRGLSYSSISLIWIGIFYSAILLIQNYNSELLYGFKQIAFQGRYIFPVVGALYILATKTIKFMPIKLLQWSMVAFTIALLLHGGPITILLGLNSFLINWFNI